MLTFQQFLILQLLSAVLENYVLHNLDQSAATSTRPDGFNVDGLSSASELDPVGCLIPFWLPAQTKRSLRRVYRPKGSEDWEPRWHTHLHFFVMSSFRFPSASWSASVETQWKQAGKAVTWKCVPTHWSLLKWSLQVVLNHSNDVNTLLLFAPCVRPPVQCFKELPEPFT